MVAVDQQPQLDTFVRLACLLCDAPAAVLSFVDSHGVTSFASEGCAASPETLLASPLFLAAKHAPSALLSHDLQGDPQFHGDALVAAHPELTFLVGMPLVIPNTRLPIGALCVFNTRQHSYVTDKAFQALELLAQQVMEVFRLWGEANAKEQLLSRGLPLICHELNTPLHGIVGLSSLYNLPEGETILKSAGLALRVVERLADFTSIQQGHVELQALPFDVRALVAEALADAEALLSHLTVRCEVVNDCQVTSDPLRVRQVLRILLENASKFTAAGEVLVRIVCPEPEESASGAETEVRFEIHDTGVGIGREVGGHLFQPFGVGDSSLTRSHGGTGLGLVIAQALCQAMGGRIWYTSQIDQGSCFCFTITAPLSPVSNSSFSPLDRELTACAITDLLHFDTLPSASEFIQSLGDRSPSLEGDLSILVVDDNLINLKVLMAFIKRLGYEPDVCTNGEEMIEAFRTKQYDLVLTDVEMPVMDGIEATRQLRAKYGPNAPYIAGVTANTTETIRRQCLEAGMQQVLAKPLRYDTLRRTVETALGLRVVRGPTSPGPPKTPRLARLVLSGMTKPRSVSMSLRQAPALPPLCSSSPITPSPPLLPVNRARRPGLIRSPSFSAMFGNPSTIPQISAAIPSPPLGFSPLMRFSRMRAQ